MGFSLDTVKDVYIFFLFFLVIDIELYFIRYIIKGSQNISDFIGKPLKSFLLGKGGVNPILQ